MTNVRTAAWLWVAAVAAGVGESVMAVTRAVQDADFGASGWLNVGVRLVVFSVALVMAVRLAAGRRWARLGLTAMLSVLGLASLVVPAVLAMMGGQTFAQAFTDGGRLGTAFLVTRLLHIGFVVAATALMYTPSANRGLTRRGAAAATVTPVR